MNTPTHVVINWSLARASGREYPLSAVLLGSVAPDLPLYLLSVGGAAYYGGWRGWPPRAVGEQLFDKLFFYDPWWIALHNVLHSPLSLALLLAAVWIGFGRSRLLSTGGWGGWLSWLLVSCLAHTLVDIPVHHNDGPLLLWPLNWQWRFHSPVSYWHPGYYGAWCLIFEACLLLWLSVRLVWSRWAA